VEHVVALLCNPSAGGGRAARVLPEKGTHVGHPAVRVRRARELHVSADRSFAVYAEGAPSAGRRR